MLVARPESRLLEDSSKTQPPTERHVGPTRIDDTFAEAFGMRYTRVIVTAASDRWLRAGLQELCGYGSSVIGCDAEVGVERYLTADQTDDGRVGASVLAFGFSSDALGKAIVNRIGQCVMTCPTTAVFDGLGPERFEADHPPANGDQPEEPKRLPLGKQLRFFGDGFQKSKLLGDRRLWRVPVMDGEFIVEDSIGVGKGVAGGNLLILARSQMVGLAAAERAVDAIAAMDNVIAPFPGGVVRSGSKVGSRYDFLRASTSHTFCPTLRGRVDSKLSDEANCVYEIVIDGIDEASVAAAMVEGIQQAAGEGTVAISAGNYGGKLGKYHLHLRQLLDDNETANAAGATTGQ